MYQFTHDWFTPHIPIWSQVLGHLRGQPCNVLEIGSFEGRSAVWLLENILTHPQSRIVCIDPCYGNMEHTNDDTANIQRLFAMNVLVNFQHKARLIKAPSNVALKYPDVVGVQYDFIYIDGDHRSHAVLEDAVLSFRSLKTGGIMIFDDFDWTAYRDQPHNHPSTGVRAFVHAYRAYIEVVLESYQFIVRKIAEVN